MFREQDRELAEARIRELGRDHTDMIEVRISARPTGHHRHGGQEVRITSEPRGKEIVAARTRSDPGLALNETLDAFERRSGGCGTARHSSARSAPRNRLSAA
jgi:hypothetical protein